MAENKEILLNLGLEENVDRMLQGDDFRLKQILLNLLSNAIKYTDK